uniref:Putative transmembrane protein n=1 Tax=Toxoplasma gondii COUG TaxID=1074873 RepID=A0A2G8YCI6_TOXGO|nr:putative transmembrane protein [Toxoplasma gondii COUG]
MAANVVAGAVCCCSVPYPKTRAERRILLCGGVLNILLPCGVGSIVAGCCLRDNQLINTGILQLLLTLLVVGLVWSIIYGIMMMLNALSAPLASSSAPPAACADFADEASMYQASYGMEARILQKSPSRGSPEKRLSGQFPESCLNSYPAQNFVRSEFMRARTETSRELLQSVRSHSLTTSSTVAVTMSPRSSGTQQAAAGGQTTRNGGDERQEKHGDSRQDETQTTGVGVPPFSPLMLEEGREETDSRMKDELETR